MYLSEEIGVKGRLEIGSRVRDFCIMFLGGGERRGIRRRRKGKRGKEIEGKEK